MFFQIVDITAPFGLAFTKYGNMAHFRRALAVKRLL